MLNSLRTRLVVYISLIVLVTLTITSGLFYQFISSYSRREQEASLRRQATAISVQIDKIGALQAKRILASNEQLTSNKVYFVGREGNLLGSNRDDFTVPLNKTAAYERYVPATGRTMLFVSVPVNGSPGISAVVVASPLDDIRRKQLPFLYMVMAAAGVSFIVAFLGALAIGASITKPIRDLTGAAERVAHGDLSPVVESKSNDEVGRLARTFNYMVERIKRTYDAQAAFASNIAHELRTPLTSIEGYSKALLDGVPRNEAEREKSLEIIHEESKRMKRLTESMLLLSRLDSEDIKPSAVKINTGKFLERVKEKYRPKLEQAKVSMVISVGQTAGEFVSDADYLEQVLLNLVDNALRYAPAGTSITISAERAQKPNIPPQIILSVSDKGPGIPAAELKKIFDRFYSSDKGSSSGAGLGLAIAKDMAERLGGNLTVGSEPGQGATFRLTLPL